MSGAPTRSWAPPDVGPDEARRELVHFVMFAFGISWSCFGIAVALGPPAADIALIAGTFGPAAGAAILLARTGGRSALGTTLRRLTRLDGAGRATVFAAALPIVLASTARAADQLLGGTTIIEWPPWWSVPVVVAYVLVLGGPLGEEVGWRGFLLPRLEARIGPLAATITIGAVWAVWHLPLFLIPGTVQQLVPVWLFAAQIVTTSVVYTWLVHLTPHSLAPALAFHTSFNATVGLVLLQPSHSPETRPLLIALVLVAVLAVGLARTPVFHRVPPPPGTPTVRTGQ